MAEPRISQTQTLKNLGSIDLLGDRDGPALQRNVNHGSPPGGLHSALPLAQAHPGEPLKRPAGRVTSRLFGGGGQGKSAMTAPFPIVIGSEHRLAARVLDLSLPILLDIR